LDVIDSDSDWFALMAPQLAIVVAVLEEEHVTRAAERLGVPQPTVSATMRRIGDVIGTPLVQPWGRGIVATAAGRALLPAAREALMTLRAARHELQDVIDPDKGLVALGFLHTLGVRDVPRLLDAFLAAYPDISFNLKQGPAHHLVNQMRSGALDVVIVAPLPDDTDGLESVVLRDEKLYLTVAADHHFASRRSLDLRQAAGETYIALTRGHGLRQVFDKICADAGFVPQLAFEGEDIATLRGLVGAGLGIAVLPQTITNDGTVVDLTISAPAAHRQVGAVWQTGHRLPPAARRFVSFLTESGAKVLREAP
jgi:LysR family transcriptional regulator, transcription activator of glutamate synthase operon